MNGMISQFPWFEVLTLLLAVAALAVSFFALRASRRANELVGVYRRAIWTVAVEHSAERGFVVEISNNGESPARDVHLTLDVDPLHTMGGSTPIPLIAASRSGRVSLMLPGATVASEVGAANLLWIGFFEDVRRRSGQVEWTDLEDRRRVQGVTLPGSLPQ